MGILPTPNTAAYHRISVSSEISVFLSFPFWPFQMQAMALAAPLHTVWPTQEELEAGFPDHNNTTPQISAAPGKLQT